MTKTSLRADVLVGLRRNWSIEASNAKVSSGNAYYVASPYASVKASSRRVANHE